MTRKVSVPFNVLADTQLPQSITAGQQVNDQGATNAASQPPLEQNSTRGRMLHFTQSQLSLALSIQKSRPTNISTRDYCLQLRKHIKLGRPPKEEDQRYIDTAEFWRDQYSTLYLGKQRLAARIAQLELCAKQGVRWDQALHRDDNDSSFEELFPSSLIAPAERHLSNKCAPSQSSILVKELEIPNIGLILLKQSLILRRLLRDNNPPSDILLSAILSLSSAMITTIKEICVIISLEIRRNENSSDVYALRIFKTVAAAFNICLKGLQHLCRDIPGRRCKGQAIYALVYFYKTCLDQLDELCMQEASCEQAQVQQNQNKQLTCQSHEQHRRCALNSGFVDFLANLLRCPELQIEHPIYMEVVEGLSSTLLETTGSHLSQVIFGERLSTSKRPGGIPSVLENTSSPTMERAAELKGQQLGVLLKRTTEGRSGEEKQILATILGGSGDYCTNLAIPSIFIRARRRLQETLLKAVFGGDGKEFLNELKITESGEGWNKESSQVVGNLEGTFIEAVWSAVGWDLILSF